MPGSQKCSQNFDWEILSNFLMVCDVSVEMQSDSKNCWCARWRNNRACAYYKIGMCLALRKLRFNTSAVRDIYRTCVYRKIALPTQPFVRLPVTISNGLNARQSKTKQFFGIHKFGKFIDKILFKDRLTFLKKHQILSIGLIEDFSRNSVNISDCRAFSLFETVTGSRIKTNVPWFYGIHKLAEFVHYKSIIIFRIAWLFQTNIDSSH